MDETTDNKNFMKYPPNSNPPKGLVNSGILKNHFLNESAECYQNYKTLIKCSGNTQIVF